ncbi:hypothetical protein AOLI_G00191520 [Acnodon oligacanthus]
MKNLLNEGSHPNVVSVSGTASLTSAPAVFGFPYETVGCSLVLGPAFWIPPTYQNHHEDLFLKSQPTRSLNPLPPSAVTMTTGPPLRNPQMCTKLGWKPLSTQE